MLLCYYSFFVKKMKSVALCVTCRCISFTFKYRKCQRWSVLYALVKLSIFHFLNFSFFLLLHISTNQQPRCSQPRRGPPAAAHPLWKSLLLWPNTAHTCQSLSPLRRRRGQRGSRCRSPSGHSWQSWSRSTSAGSSAQQPFAPEPGAWRPERHLVLGNSLWGGTLSPTALWLH